MSADVFDTATAPARGRKLNSQRWDRVERDRSDRPLLPDIPADITSEPDWSTKQGRTSVSTLSNAIKETFALSQWGERKVAKGIALRPDLYALVCALDPDEDRKQFQAVCTDAKSAAAGFSGANHGTALHAFTRRIDDGAVIAEVLRTVPSHLAADVQAYVAGMVTHQLSILPGMTERMIFCPELNAAGSFDKVSTRPTWQLPRIGDTKSPQQIEYSGLEISVQLAIYAHAAAIWNPDTRRYEPMPEVDQEWAAVLWLPAGQGRFEPLDVDLTLGWELAKLAHTLHGARKRKDFMRPMAPVARGDALTALVAEEIAALNSANPVRRMLAESALNAADDAGVFDPPAQAPAPLPNTWEAQIRMAAGRGALSAVWKAASALGEWTPELAAAGKARMAELGIS